MAARLAVRGSRRANASLSKYFDNIRSWPRLSDDIFFYLQEITRESFNEEGREGIKWPDYWAQEQKYGGKKWAKFIEAGEERLFPRLLRWLPGRERLFPSLMHARHPNAIRHVRDDHLEYGTSVDYAARHQHGQGENEFGEPVAERPFLVIVAEDVAAIRRMIADHVGI